MRIELPIRALAVAALACLPAPPALATDPDPAPQLLTVIVLDTSGSMGDGKLEAARAEIKDRARRLPPSPHRPYALIPFHGSVHDARVFTGGAPELEGHLDRLAAGGGTAIAAGLRHALGELDRSPAAGHVAVLLYTDGEDADRAAVAEQEARLDARFRDRTERGLGQTVICRRWGSANADLVALLRRGGHAEVIDAGEARLLHATLAPRVAARGCRWAGERTLAIDLRAEVEVRGPAGSAAIPPLRLTCANAGAQGDAAVDVAPGGPQPVDFAVRLPVTGREVPKSVRLEFTVSAPQPAVRGADILVPTLADERVAVEVAVPPPVLRATLDAALAPSGHARWQDPLRRRAIVEAELIADIGVAPDFAFPHPVPLALNPDPAVELLSDVKEFPIGGAGRVRLPLKLAYDPATTPSPGLTVGPAGREPAVRFEPAGRHAAVAAGAPAPVVTTIAITPLSVGRPAWSDLLEGTATFEARIRVRVDGPLGDRTALAVTAPAGVRGLRITPAVIRGGDQTVTLAIAARLRPAPATTALDFTVATPPPRGAVRFRTRDAFRIVAPGPPPVRVALTRDGRPLTHAELLVEDGAPAALAATPAVIGIADADAARGLSADLADIPALALKSPGRLPFFRPARILLAPPEAPPGRSFFRDSCWRSDLKIDASPARPYIAPSSCRVILRSPAPFKRIAFLALLGTFAVLLVAIPARAYWNLRGARLSPSIRPEPVIAPAASRSGRRRTGLGPGAGR